MAEKSSEQEQCQAMAVTAVVILALFLAIFAKLMGPWGLAAGLTVIGVTAVGMVCFEHSGWFDKSRKHPR